METMEKYTIYCTEEQTKKALELGAPIKESPMIDLLRNEIGNHCLLCGSNACWYPTAEQMLGWLEEQGVSCYMYKKIDCPIYTIVRAGSIKEQMIWARYYTSRKKATLAAIDAALDYLIKDKK